jgi:hypothetical protein
MCLLSLIVIFYQRPEPTAVQEEAIKTLLMLFAKAADKPEVQREVTTPNLPKFNHALLNLSGNKDLLVRSTIHISIQ